MLFENTFYLYFLSISLHESRYLRLNFLTNNDSNFITVQLVCSLKYKRWKKIYSFNYFVDNKNGKQEVTE